MEDTLVLKPKEFIVKSGLAINVMDYKTINVFDNDLVEGVYHSGHSNVLGYYKGIFVKVSQLIK